MDRGRTEDAREAGSWSRQLRASPDSGAEARWFLGEVLAERRTDVMVHLAALLITEVASNAARHGSPGVGSPIDVAITASEDSRRVRVSVRDRGPGFDADDEIANGTGWGVRLVEALATDWGVVRGDDSTEVWFEV